MGFIQPTFVPLSFSQGLNGKEDPFQVKPNGLLALTNGVFDKIGRLNKRYGNDILSTNVTDGQIITSAFAIDNFLRELNLFDNQNIYTYNAANNNWANRGTAISIINSNQQIIRTSSAQQLNPDSTYLNGIKVFAWEDSRGPGVRYSVLDTVTGSYSVADRSVVASLTAPKLIVFNNLIYLFYTDKNNLYFRTIDTDNPFVISNQTVAISDGPDDFVYDLAVSGNRLYIAYQADPAAINVAYIDTSNVPHTVTTLASGTDAISNPIYSSITLTIDSLSNIWVAWSTGVDVRYAVLNSAHSVLLADTVVDTVEAPTMTIIEGNSPGATQLIYEVQAAAVSAPAIQSENQSIKSVSLTISGTVATVGQVLSVGLASKAFKYNQNIYVNTILETPLQATYFTILVNPGLHGKVVGKVNAQVGGVLSTNGMLPSITVVENDGVFLWANLVKGVYISENNTNFSLLGVNATTTDFTSVNKFNSVTQSNNLLFVGGILQSYDGVSVVEQNFNYYPEGIVSTYFTTGGALSQGQYQYQVVYAWTDRFGQVQYSTPSVTVTVQSSTATGSVLLQIPTLRLTNKSDVVIKVYRTQVNGVVFQEVTSELAPLLNDTTVNYVNFTDTVADVQMASNATIYTTGGVLANTAPPFCSLIATFQDRVMLAGLEDPNLIWFSKNKVNATNFNTIPVEFAAENTIAITQLGGPITAMITMDDKLVIFKRSSIYVQTGDGPNDTGGGNAFPPVELVSNSVGCDNPNSVVLTKNGIMFQSIKGIWLLDRSLGEPQYIGAGVDNVAKDHLISSAVVDPNDNHIIFTTYDDVACVYDYYNNQWTEFTNHQARDAVAFNGTYCFVKSNGEVYQQNREIYTDGTSFIPLSFTTPWLSFAQMIGYQRVFRCWLLGEFKGPHNLDVSVAYDFNSYFEDGYIIPATIISGQNLWGSESLWGDSDIWGGEFQPYQFQINFQRQTCTSIRLKFSDSQTSNYNEGYTISNLNFEVGIMGGNNRLPKKNKVGVQ